jgi:hypothetical protein
VALAFVMDDYMATPAEKVAADLTTHEAVCAERYLGINARLKRLEMILLGAAGTLIVLLINIVIKLN